MLDECIFSTMASYVEGHSIKANLYVFITYQAGGGTVGKAWNPSICDDESNRKYRMSVNAWFSSDQETGEVCNCTYYST